jgi:diaminopimelate decarboxylase
VLDLFPDSAEVEAGELRLGGVGAATLAEEFGTPLVVYCERTIRAQARAYRAVVPDGLVVYGTKAFANVSLLRVLLEEGVGADVSTLGELAVARRAGLGGSHILFHGNNKSDEELAAAAAAGALVVLDSVEEVERASAAGLERVLVRHNPGVEAATHASIRTAHERSKFGLGAEGVLEAIERSRTAGLGLVGVHVHIGSQLVRPAESLTAVERLVELLTRARDELDWRPEVVDLGGGLAVRHAPEDEAPSADEFARAVVDRFRALWPEPARLVLEPGRSLVGRAGVTLYRVGVVKRTGDVTDVAIDGGMSDNPRPQLYGARYTAVVAGRADAEPDGEYRVVGKHCESGDVLIERVALAAPRRADLLAVPATGAYSLAMGSNYNGVPRPAAVLVSDGARLIRRRETVADLLGLDA